MLLLVLGKLVWWFIVLVWLLVVLVYPLVVLVCPLVVLVVLPVCRSFYNWSSWGLKAIKFWVSKFIYVCIVDNAPWKSEKRIRLWNLLSCLCSHDKMLWAVKYVIIRGFARSFLWYVMEVVSCFSTEILVVYKNR